MPLAEEEGRWVVTGKSGETLTITIEEILSDTAFDLGVDPGLVKDGVEAHLQELLAAQVSLLGADWRLVRREYPTAIGPVDLMCRDAAGGSVAIEIKRRGEIDGVEQLTRYLDLLNRDPLLAPVQGVFAAQEIKPQARVLAEDRGIRCLILDYESMRGTDDGALRLLEPVTAQALGGRVQPDQQPPVGQHAAQPGGPALRRPLLLGFPVFQLGEQEPASP